MQKAVLAIVRSGNVRAANGDPETRAPSLDEVLSELHSDIRVVIEEEAVNAFGEGFADFSLEIAAQVDAKLLIEFDLISERVKDWARDQAAEKIVGISEGTATQVREILTDSLQNGESIDELAGRLSRKFDEFKGIRSETIARTETAGSYNAGKFWNAEEFQSQNPDLQLMKKWVPTQDERTREEHRASQIKDIRGNTATTVPLYEPFMVGGEAMMRPLDPDGSAKNVVRCRCVMTNSVKGME
jgi:hypothetical protein